jgi:VIT1/CCC1 family predicted Fe2+/Mn2+ transporter
MRVSFKTGLCFGLTSGIITTLGLMVGLHSGTHSVLAVIGGVLTIAVADAFSDALGIHISKESENHHPKYVWETTAATFLVKFFFPLTFLVPILLVNIETAILTNIVWGLSMIGVLSFMIAKAKKENPFGMITEHVGIALLVIVITHIVGDLISGYFAVI